MIENVPSDTYNFTFNLLVKKRRKGVKDTKLVKERCKRT